MGMVMGTKPSTKATSEPKGAGKGKDEDGKPNKGNRKPKGPKRELKCYHCGGRHKVAECPTCPADRKSWKPSQWWAEQKTKERAAKAAGTNSHPGGENGAKKSLQVNEGCERGAEAVKNGKTVAGGVCYADGPATVGGVARYWTADGGCNKATISAAYARKLEKAGVKIVKYDDWKTAQLADGTSKPMISGHCIADIVIRHSDEGGGSNLTSHAH